MKESAETGVVSKLLEHSGETKTINCQIVGHGLQDKQCLCPMRKVHFPDSWLEPRHGDVRSTCS
jgi:hypothetical protein